MPFLFLLSILFCTAFAQQNSPKIAVYVANSELKDAEKKMLGAKILAPFIQSKQYIAIEQNDAFLNGIAIERQKQIDGSVDDKQISRLGKEAGAQFVCVAVLVDASGRYNVSARLIDTETAQIVGMGETGMNYLSGLSKAADEIFRQISGSATRSAPNPVNAKKDDLETEKPKNTLEQEKQKAALEQEQQKAALEQEQQIADLDSASERESASASESSGYSNFSEIDRWKTWAVNALTINGLGSVIFMGDVLGGIVHLGLGVGAVVSLVNAMNAEDRSAELALFSGFYFSGFVWNIFRSATYDKPNPNASLLDPSHFNLAILPNKKGDGMAYGLKYNLKF